MILSFGRESKKRFTPSSFSRLLDKLQSKERMTQHSHQLCVSKSWCACSVRGCVWVRPGLCVCFECGTYSRSDSWGPCCRILSSPSKLSPFRLKWVSLCRTHRETDTQTDTQVVHQGVNTGSPSQLWCAHTSFFLFVFWKSTSLFWLIKENRSHTHTVNSSQLILHNNKINYCQFFFWQFLSFL